METRWLPAANRLDYGRWAFAELKDVYTMRTDFEAAQRRPCSFRRRYTRRR